MKLIAELIVCAFMGVAIAFILLGWLYQCGESYVDAQGVRHVVECKGEITRPFSWSSTTDPAKGKP
jgi:hypothetical protein